MTTETIIARIVLGLLAYFGTVVMLTMVLNAVDGPYFVTLFVGIANGLIIGWALVHAF